MKRFARVLAAASYQNHLFWVRARLEEFSMLKQKLATVYFQVGRKRKFHKHTTKLQAQYCFEIRLYNAAGIASAATLSHKIQGQLLQKKSILTLPLVLSPSHLLALQKNSVRKAYDKSLPGSKEPIHSQLPSWIATASKAKKLVHWFLSTRSYIFSLPLSSFIFLVDSGDAI